MNKFYKVSQAELSKADETLSVEDITLPKRATSFSAGYDFFAPYSFNINAGETLKIPTGIKVELDKDKFLAIVPRSGLGFKFRLQLDNTVGIIDSDYFNNNSNEGHIWIKITNDSRENKVLSLRQGEAFAQGIILRYYKTEDDCVTVDRTGGFGSTTNTVV